MKVGMGQTRRAQPVNISRFAAWAAFTGAVVSEGAILFICYRLVDSRLQESFTAIAWPLAIGVFGCAIVLSARYFERRTRPRLEDGKQRAGESLPTNIHSAPPSQHRPAA